MPALILPCGAQRSGGGGPPGASVASEGGGGGIHSFHFAAEDPRTVHVEVACATSSPSCLHARDCRKKNFRPLRRKLPSQRTSPPVTGARYCTFISSVVPAPATWCSRCPMEISMAVARMPPCSVPCGLNMVS